MGVDDPRKLLKKSIGDGLGKQTRLKKKKFKTKKLKVSYGISSVVQKEESICEVKDLKKRSSHQKRRKGDNIDVEQISIKASSDGGKVKRMLSSYKKRKDKVIVEVEGDEVSKAFGKLEDSFDERHGGNKLGEKKKRKTKKRKIKDEKVNGSMIDELCNDVEEASVQQYGKSKKVSKMSKKDPSSSKKHDNLLEKREEIEPNEAAQISSEDEDCSRGMKRWIAEYHIRRPGLKILQQRIDDFITSHEAQEGQARKEQEALAAEGGWTVVTHHKGRKKTTDSETGVTVGSVSAAAVMDKMARKKTKEVALNFYRFQRREAQKNEIMMLRSKFEQDKKRIQQLRAARKFKPY